MNKKKCKYCGKKFVPVHGNNSFCSVACKKAARTLRNYKRYNSINRLLPVMLANHEVLLALDNKKITEVTVQELESEGLDFSLFRRLYPDPGNNLLVRLDFGTYFLQTEDNFKTFKLYRHEAQTS